METYFEDYQETQELNANTIRAVKAELLCFTEELLRVTQYVFGYLLCRQ